MYLKSKLSHTHIVEKGIFYSLYSLGSSVKVFIVSLSDFDIHNISLIDHNHMLGSINCSSFKSTKWIGANYFEVEFNAKDLINNNIIRFSTNTNSLSPKDFFDIT